MKDSDESKKTDSSAQFNLRIFTENRKTHTRIPVKRKDTLVFHNDSKETLRITVDKDDALLDCGKGVDLIKVEPGQSRSLVVNPKYPVGSVFKYTATIAGSETEDPIIIIEE
ncbi:MAG: hypothetical protein WD944_08740 [Steroidobacteraceae bacterium]